MRVQGFVCEIRIPYYCLPKMHSDHMTFRDNVNSFQNLNYSKLSKLFETVPIASFPYTVEI